MDSYTIDELVAQYHLENGLCDIYVEGATDVRVIRTFCQHHGLDVGVQDIDTVDVPNYLVA